MNIERVEPISPAEAARRNSEERRLNDLARTEMGEKGRLVATQGIMALEFLDRRTLCRAIQAFGSWDDGDDPYGVHDFGCLYGTGPSGDIAWSAEATDSEKDPFVGIKVFWKIDVFEEDMLHGAERPWVEGESVRLLTVMLASEY